MKLAITTENKLGITDDVLSLLRSHQADLIKVEVEDGKIYLHTQGMEKTVQGTIASQLMKIPGIKWVNQIEVLPGVETQNMLASLMQVMPDPVTPKVKSHLPIAKPVCCLSHILKIIKFPVE
jgi:transcriptional regulator of aroF, aroG, tyrA and aromatic amino acid transport